VSLIALALSLCSPALAEEDTPAADAPQADASADPQQAAKEAFGRATEHYNVGRFEEALAEYETAYRLSKLPALLFNIGQCHFALERYERAVFFYEGYLRESPEGAHRDLVTERLEQARAAQAEDERRAEQERATQSEREKRWRTLRCGAWGSAAPSSSPPPWREASRSRSR
jgi:tetratricopeptide (TPR) repeat protein